MIKSRINNMKIFGYHGVYDYEKKEGQNFYITLDYSYNVAELKKDELSNVLDYVSVIKYIRSFFKKNNYNLLEKLIYDLSYNLNEKFKNYNFKCLSISITKRIFVDNDKDGINIMVEKSFSDE